MSVGPVPPAIQARIAAGLAEIYPQGYSILTTGGRRTAELAAYPCPFGFRVCVDGEWVLFDATGAFSSRGYRNRGARAGKRSGAADGQG